MRVLARLSWSKECKLFRSIARGLLSSTSNVEKRITRAKSKLREVGEEIAALTSDCMQARLDAVLQVLYLLFNEGFSASHGESAIDHRCGWY